MDAPRANPWLALEAEPPDFAEWPVVPRPHRRWTYELESQRLASGRCESCDGRHVTDHATLEVLISAVSMGSTEAPCTCSCCVAEI